ncbi:MAG: AEC family transporter [Oscillospiraceae bacterium]|nr:AEC family transporter [Oscillospiraceae bacterium]
MEKFLTVAQVVAPIFVSILLGMLAKKKSWVSPEGIQGFQDFVMKIGLPCVVFNSCLTADMGAESVSSMAFVLPLMILSTLWAFRARKKQFPYYNLPQLFCAQETGMLGIPLFMILFGADQAYRVGVLDLTQAVTAYPVIAILSSGAGANLSVPQIAKKVITSPLMIMSLLGLALNFSGVGDWLDSVGVGAVITESTGFLSQPISALMIFSVGYNFSLSKESRKAVFRISALHFVLFAVFCGIIQLGLCLVPNMDALTRWAILLYCFLPASYLAPALGRSKEDREMASGVCSILTVTSLMVFCIMAAVVA